MTLLLHYWLVLSGDPFFLFAVYFIAYQLMGHGLQQMD